MSARLSLLVPEFFPRVQELLAACRTRGVEMRPSQTVRTPIEQARLWRQSRTRAEVEAAIANLRTRGAPFLAECMIKAGPQSGPHVTNALPGLSWHQWGEAVDCFWVVDGQAVWSAQRLVNGQNGFRVYAEEANRLGLDAGGFWKSLKDWPHVQLRKSKGPASVFPMPQIDQEMRARFSAIDITSPVLPQPAGT